MIVVTAKVPQEEYVLTPTPMDHKTMAQSAYQWPHGGERSQTVKPKKDVRICSYAIF